MVAGGGREALNSFSAKGGGQREWLRFLVSVFAGRGECFRKK